MNRIIDKNRKHARRKLHIRKSISGTALRPRMTVFRSNLHMYVQVIDDTTGRTLVRDGERTNRGVNADDLGNNLVCLDDAEVRARSSDA